MAIMLLKNMESYNFYFSLVKLVDFSYHVEVSQSCTFLPKTHENCVNERVENQKIVRLH